MSTSNDSQTRIANLGPRIEFCKLLISFGKPGVVWDWAGRCVPVVCRGDTGWSHPGRPPGPRTFHNRDMLARAFRLAVVAVGVFLAAIPVAGQQEPRQRTAREIFQRLIEINTTNSVGDNTRAAEAMAARFRAAGFRRAMSRCWRQRRRRGIWWCGFTERARRGRCCPLVTWMSWKRNVRTGRSIRLSSGRKADIFTGAAQGMKGDDAIRCHVLAEGRGLPACPRHDSRVDLG